MRLISQDGKWDIPYDSVGLHTAIPVKNVKDYYSISFKDDFNYEIIAKYSSKELMDFILIKLRTSYSYGEKYFKFESEEEVQKQKDIEEGIENKIQYKD